jgi:hypothetical protein
MNKIYTNLENCRICKSTDMQEVIGIEDQFLSPTFVKTNENNPMSSIKVPHTLMLCNCCSLLQLKETVEQDLLYREYFYRSSTNDMMREDLHAVVQDVMTRVNLSPGDSVLDIGANDCTMLSYFPKSLKRHGIEPAKNIDWSKVEKDIKIVNDYFNSTSVDCAVGEEKVKIFTSCAMFYDIDDPNAFVDTIKRKLHKDGVFCIQLSYLPAMLTNLNFYDICNEHLEYYSLNSLQALMSRHNLEIFDAEENHVNGGSVRVMITHTENNRARSENLRKLFETESKMKLADPNTYEDFHDKIKDMKEKVANHIQTEIDSGNVVLGLGASTKGNMLLQLFGLTKDKIPAISERNPDKVGLKTLGTDIELISEVDARSRQPSCMLVLPWYFKKEIAARESDYIESGGTLLMPMPYPHLITKGGEVRL